MYNIQNCSGKNVALMLERGGYVLRPSQYLDLDKLCSRKWIINNFDLKKLFQTGTLRLVHDSTVVLAKAPTRIITRYQTPAGEARVASNKPVEVIDLSKHPDVEVDESGRIHKPLAAEPVAKQPEPPRVENTPVEVKTAIEVATKVVAESVAQAAIETVQKAASAAANRAAVEAVANIMSRPIAKNDEAQAAFPLPTPEAQIRSGRAPLSQIPLPRPESYIKNRTLSKKADKLKGKRLVAEEPNTLGLPRKTE